jgi:hypothetical protein
MGSSSIAARLPKLVTVRWYSHIHVQTVCAVSRVLGDIVRGQMRAKKGHSHDGAYDRLDPQTILPISRAVNIGLDNGSAE